MQSSKFDASALTYIPDKLTAVSYCDGDISQMEAIKSGTDLFTDNKVDDDGATGDDDGTGATGDDNNDDNDGDDDDR